MTHRVDAKKERVLHTRVPAALENELKRFAQNLRVPVSNLVRTILEDAVDARKIRPDPLSDVYAFQQVTVAQPAHCAKCDAELEAGAHAHLGLLDPVTSGGLTKIFVCDDCLPKREKHSG